MLSAASLLWSKVRTRPAGSVYSRAGSVMIDKEVAQVQSVSFRSDGGAALRRMMERKMNIHSKGEKKGRKKSV